MNIQILQLLDGARAAKGLTVIIDVFRAFSMEAYLLASGADKIIPVGDIQLAYQLKNENPQFILAGEREGKILPNFDIGNSPSQMMSINVKGKTVIHTTSAGSQGIVNAFGADEILGGCLVNARATAKYISNSGARDISLVCMGLGALVPIEEDTFCANYIKSLLEGRTMDLATEIEQLKYTSGAKFFDPTQNDVFPQNDFFMCTDIDQFDFVLKLVKPQKGLSYITRQDV